MPVVDLTVYDFFTNVVLMLGWLLSNAAWNILEQTMLAAVPFIALIVREFYEARREGEDEGTQGLLALNRIETKLYPMLLIFVFCAVPLLPVTFAPVTIDQTHLQKCSVRMAAGGTTAPVGGAIGGASPSIPVWWGFVHAVSRGVTNAMISVLPCQTNYLYIRTELSLETIQDPVLRREVARFQRVCYGAARAKLFRQSSGLSAARAKDVDWIGSRYFLTTPGYYDSFSANRPVNGFPFDPATDAGRGTPASAGGYPTCKQWWSAPNIGLKDRLHDQIDTSLWQEIKGAFSSASAEEYAIRGLLHNRVGGAQGNAGGVTADIGGSSLDIVNTIGGVVGFAGTLFNSVFALGSRDTLSRALPMVLHLLMMVVVIAIPFVLVLSGYSFKVAGVLTFSYFGLATMPFWFQVTRWLNNNLIELVYDSQAAQLSFIAGLASTYDRGVLVLVLVAMQLIFPLAWLTLLGWSGWAVGSGIDGVFKGGSEEAKSAGRGI